MAGRWRGKYCIIALRLACTDMIGILQRCVRNAYSKIAGACSKPMVSLHPNAMLPICATTHKTEQPAIIVHDSLTPTQ
jgi:hypothetical protein